MSSNYKSSKDGILPYASYLLIMRAEFYQHTSLENCVCLVIFMQRHRLKLICIIVILCSTVKKIVLTD